MEAQVSWQNGLAFIGTADSGYQLPLDGKKEVGGGENGFLPMEMFAIGLAGCTAMDVISILKKMREDVTDFKVKVNAERRDEHPRIFTDIMIEYFVTGHNLDSKAVEKAVKLSEERYCPGQAILEKTANINHRITIEEAL